MAKNSTNFLKYMNLQIQEFNELPWDEPRDPPRHITIKPSRTGSLKAAKKQLIKYKSLIRLLADLSIEKLAGAKIER